MRMSFHVSRRINSQQKFLCIGQESPRMPSVYQGLLLRLLYSFNMSLRITCCTTFNGCVKRKASLSHCCSLSGPALTTLSQSKIQALDLFYLKLKCTIIGTNSLLHCRFLLEVMTHLFGFRFLFSTFKKEASLRVKFGLIKFCINYILTLHY